MSEDGSSSSSSETKAESTLFVSTFMPEIDFDVAYPSWLKLLPAVEAISHEVIREIFKDPERQLAGDMELSLMLVDDATIQELNRDHRGKDKPTNVLTFNALEWDAPLRVASGQWFEGQPMILGDIIFALETTRTEAQRDGKSLEHHYMHLLVHGLLHSLGYDHMNEAEAEEMEALEVALLKKLGVENPYQIVAELV